MAPGCGSDGGAESGLGTVAADSAGGDTSTTGRGGDGALPSDDQGRDRSGPPAGAEGETAGTPAYDPTTVGTGACAGVSAQDVLDQLHATYTQFPDIVTFAPDPSEAADTGGGSQLIHAFLTATGGWRLVLFRGAGDCPAGCIDRWYYYFETDDACAPQQVGEFHPEWTNEGCLEVDGAPRWGLPEPPDPSTVCEADNTPQDISGTWTVHASGQHQPCAGPGEGTAPDPIDQAITLTIEQTGNLSEGTVSVSGLAHPLLDGVELPATFSRRRFEVEDAFSSLPTACPWEYTITVRYDFELFIDGYLEVFEYGSAQCDECKGLLSAQLTPGQ